VLPQLLDAEEGQTLIFTRTNGGTPRLAKKLVPETGLLPDNCRQ
jgi:hypothetical protein